MLNMYTIEMRFVIYIPPDAGLFCVRGILFLEYNELCFFHPPTRLAAWENETL